MRTETPGLGLLGRPAYAERLQSCVRCVRSDLASPAEHIPSPALPLIAVRSRCLPLPCPTSGIHQRGRPPLPTEASLPLSVAALRFAAHSCTWIVLSLLFCDVGCSRSARSRSASTATTSSRSRGGGDDYYSGRGEAPGEWVGAGAQALGLSGRVSAEQFGALIAGLDPRDPACACGPPTRDPKVAALDLTFSAPKSVSVLFAVAPEEISGVLVGVPRGGGQGRARVPGGRRRDGAPRRRQASASSARRG